MTLIQELMNQANVGGLLNPTAIKRFTPAEIRETIQTLVATEQLALANALGDAGLSLYPHSEDMLAISSLLAVSPALTSVCARPDGSELAAVAAGGAAADVVSAGASDFSIATGFSSAAGGVGAGAGEGASLG